jgi:hypothetical protein
VSGRTRTNGSRPNALARKCSSHGRMGFPWRELTAPVRPVGACFIEIGPLQRSSVRLSDQPDTLPEEALDDLLGLLGGERCVDEERSGRNPAQAPRRSGSTRQFPSAPGECHRHPRPTFVPAQPTERTRRGRKRRHGESMNEENAAQPEGRGGGCSGSRHNPIILLQARSDK